MEKHEIMKTKGTFIAALTLGILSSCGDGDSLSSKVRTYIEESDAQRQLFCDCYEQFGFDSVSACENAFTTYGPSQERCLNDAFARDAEAANAWFDCVLPLEAELSECVDARLSCSDGPSSIDPCTADYEVGFEQCIVLPPAVQRAIENCVPDGQ